MEHPNHKLVGFLEGSLSDAERAEVERHLTSCPACRAELGTLGAAGRALQAAASHVTRPQFDPAMWSRVRAQITPPSRPRLFNLRWAAASGGLAVTAMAVVIIYVNGGQFNIPEQEPAQKRAPVTASQPKRSPLSEKTTSPTVPTARPEPAASAPPAARTRPTPTSAAVPTAEAPGEKSVGSGRDAAGSAPLGLGRETIAGSPGPSAGGLPHEIVAAVPGAPVVDGVTLSPAMPSSPEAKASAPRAERSRGAPPGVAEPPPPAVSDRVVALATPKPVALNREQTYKMDKGGSQGFAPRAQRYLAEADVARRNNQRPAEAAYLNNAINSGLTGEELRAAHLRLGDVFLQQGDAVRALVAFREANKVRPGSDALNRIGVACERTGEPKGAREAYEQSLQLDPGNAEAKAGLERVRAAG